MNALNLSAEPPGCLHALLPHELRAEAVVFVPDICPGKSPLPMCTAVLTRQDDWRRFAVSDCGCGMRLVRSELALADLDARAWDAIPEAPRAKMGGLGDLGGGHQYFAASAPMRTIDYTC